MMKHSSTSQFYKIRAAVLRKKGGPLKIESLEMEGPRANEVLVHVVASGICHTDIDFIDDWDDADTPVVLGHEGAGVVEQVGEGLRVSRMAIMLCSPTSPAATAGNVSADAPRTASTFMRRTSVSNAWTVAMHCKGAESAATFSASRRSLLTSWRPSATSSRSPKNLASNFWRPLGAAFRPEPAL